MTGKSIRELAALTMGLTPVYGFAIWSHLTRGRTLTLQEMLLYPLLLGGGGLVWILALWRYWCGEPFASLNRRAGSYWRDALTGAGLAAFFVLLAWMEQPLLERWAPPRRTGDAMALIRGLLESPAAAAFWFGPVLWIGVAGFEEVSRVFCLTRLWAAWPGRAGQWFAVLFSAALFGAAHVYQGAPGAISSGVMGLVWGCWYARYGRVGVLVASHALYDIWSIGVGLWMVRKAMG